MTTELSIRKGSSTDLLLLQKIGRQAFADTFSEHNTDENMSMYLEKTYSTEKVGAELRDTKSIFLLVFDGNNCAGYVKLKEGVPDEKSIEIERLYAVKEYIGKQVGRKLMEASLSYAQENNYETIWLGVWEKNLRAIRFYEKFGFRKFGEHVFVLGLDPQNDWLMKKTLI